MTQQTIGIGSAANDGTGDPLRTAFVKCNGNFDELYAIVPLPGPEGPQGPKGDTGDAGPQGPQGPVGVATATPPLTLTGTTLSIDLSAYASLASPVFTGNPTAPTPPVIDNDTSIATTAFVKNVLTSNYQPLDGDLTSLANATSSNALYYRSSGETWAPVTIGSGLTFSGGTLNANLSAYAPLASPIFTGDPQAPTPAAGDNDTSIATTAFVVTKAANYLPLAGGTLTGDLGLAGASGYSTIVLSASSGNYLSFLTHFTGINYFDTIGDLQVRTGPTGLASNVLRVYSDSGRVEFQATAASISPTSGALTVAGGLGVGQDIHVAGDVYTTRAATPTTGAYFFGNSMSNYLFYTGTGFSLNGGPLTVNSTTASTSPTTGALTVAGGLGVVGNISVGGGAAGSTIAINNSSFTNVAFNNVAGAGVWSIGKDAIGRFVVTASGIADWIVATASTGNVQIFSTTASTSPTTGALTVAGGLGIAGSIYVGGGGFKPAGGPWSDSSDARIKTVLGDYEHGLAEVLQLAPKRYRYKGNDTNDPTTATKLPYEDSPHYSVAVAGTEYIGLIAQEVEAVMPEMVTFATGYIDGKNKIHDIRRLDTGALIYALLNSIKELNARVQALEGTAI